MALIICADYPLQPTIRDRYTEDSGLFSGYQVGSCAGELSHCLRLKQEQLHIKCTASDETTLR